MFNEFHYSTSQWTYFAIGLVLKKRLIDSIKGCCILTGLASPVSSQSMFKLNANDARVLNESINKL